MLAVKKPVRAFCYINSVCGQVHSAEAFVINEITIQATEVYG